MSSPTAVAAALRTQILALEFAPGTPLREVALAAEHGCSRRTIREALQELAREGLVTHEPNKGAVVRTFTARDIRDLYQVRRTLEGQGAAACHTAPASRLRAVAAAHDLLSAAARGNQDSLAHALADLQFHAAVIGLIGSDRIDRMFAQVSTEMVFAIRLILQREVSERVHVEAVIADHTRIRDAVLARDPLAAQRAVQQHIDDYEPQLLRWVPPPSR